MAQQGNKYDSNKRKNNRITICVENRIPKYAVIQEQSQVVFIINKRIYVDICDKYNNGQDGKDNKWHKQKQKFFKFLHAITAFGVLYACVKLGTN